MDLSLPDGVVVRPISIYSDTRGDLSEIYREEWLPKSYPSAIQWNYVCSAANVLRGVHLHRKHYDYLTLLSGKMLLGLSDLREKSATYRMGCLLPLEQHQPRLVVIPPGVAHGFYFTCASIHVYGVSSYWSPEDEFGCLYSDPGLNIDWNLQQEPILSERDVQLKSLLELQNSIRSWEEL